MLQKLQDAVQVPDIRQRLQYVLIIFAVYILALHVPAAGINHDAMDRLLQSGACLELGKKTVHVVDVLGALDLRDHDHVELVADLGHRRDDVVEAPGRVQRVHPRPELSAAEVDALAHVDEALSGGVDSDDGEADDEAMALVDLSAAVFDDDE